MAYELVNAVVMHGVVDISALIAVGLCNKMCHTAIACNVADAIISQDTHTNIIWFAKIMGLELTLPAVQNLFDRLINGDVPLMIDVFKTNVFFDMSCHDRLITLCFNFDKYPSVDAVDTMMRYFSKTFLQCYPIWKKKRSLEEMFTVTCLFARILSKCVMWAIKNQRGLRGLPFFEMEEFFSQVYKRLREIHINCMALITDPETYMYVRDSFFQVQTLCIAWRWKIMNNTDLHIGSKGGVFYFKQNGKKCYKFGKS